MSESQSPSLLQPAGGRHETITSRIATIKSLAESCHLPVPDEFSADQHFWFRVQQSFSSERSLLRQEAPEIPRDRQRRIAIKSSVRHAIQVCEEEKNRATDALTGLWSRAALDNYLARLLGKLNRDSDSQSGIWGIGIAMLDIDNFKPINDKYGHTTGDLFLVNFGQALVDNSRTIGDMAARYGGEEFALIMPLRHPQAPEEIAQRAKLIRRQLVNSLTVEHQGATLSTTASMGVAIITQSDKVATLKAAYDLADAALYHAKTQGKNQGILYIGQDAKGQSLFEKITL